MAAVKYSQKELRHILKNLYKVHLANPKGSTFDSKIILGEIGDLRTEAQYKVCKDLKEVGVLKSMTKEKFTSDNSHGYSDHAELNCVVSRKKLLDLVIAESIQPKYYLTFSSDTYLLLSDLHNTYLLRTPNFESENYFFIKTILDNNNKVTKIQEIEKAMGLDKNGKQKRLKKSPSSSLRDLKLNRELRKIFIVHASKDAVEIRNPVFQKDFDKLEINEKVLKQQISKFKKIKM